MDQETETVRVGHYLLDRQLIPALRRLSGGKSKNPGHYKEQKKQPFTSHMYHLLDTRRARATRRWSLVVCRSGSPGIRSLGRRLWACLARGEGKQGQAAGGGSVASGTWRSRKPHTRFSFPTSLSRPAGLLSSGFPETPPTPANPAKSSPARHSPGAHAYGRQRP